MDQNTPPFWQQFGFFFRYLNQEKLYYQITLLAAANILLAIPSLVLTLLIGAMLFLASYKLAFEVLHTVSAGQMEYVDSRTYEIDDKIGFKAIAMGVVQILIYMFVYRTDPPLGLALLILTLVATPAYLMMLSKTQSVIESFNPFNLMTVMSRIGFEYVMLLLFFIVCAALNLAFRYYTIDLMPGVIGGVLTAWVLYFLLVFTFLVVGYVMYRHADDLGHDTIDVEVVDTQSTHSEDPIKDRIKTLIEQNQAQEAINIISELKREDGRTDLDNFLSEAQTLLVHKKRQRPADRLTELVQNGSFDEAIAMYFSYAEDGHLIKPQNADTISQMIQHCFTKNRFNEVIKLNRGFDQRYPLEHEDIVKNYFLVAKILYQNKKIKEAKKLLQSLIDKYGGSVDTKGVHSYLLGIQKMNQK